jgi:hypothetical protein
MDKIVDTVWTFMLFCSSYKLLMIENHKKNSYNAVVKFCLSFLFVIYDNDNGFVFMVSYGYFKIYI